VDRRIASATGAFQRAQTDPAASVIGPVDLAAATHARAAAAACPAWEAHEAGASVAVAVEAVALAVAAVAGAVVAEGVRDGGES